MGCNASSLRCLETDKGGQGGGGGGGRGGGEGSPVAIRNQTEVVTCVYLMGLFAWYCFNCLWTDVVNLEVTYKCVGKI